MEGQVQRIWHGPAYECSSTVVTGGEVIRVTTENSSVLADYLPERQSDAEAGVPMFASMEGGVAVAVCCSARVGIGAHEAGVESHPEFRGRGHGKRAVAGWAQFVRELDQIPLYSSSWENRPSQALAAGLRFRRFGADIHIT